MTRDVQEQVLALTRRLNAFSDLKKNEAYIEMMKRVAVALHSSKALALNATEPSYAMKMLGAAYAYNECTVLVDREIEATKQELRVLTAE